MDGAKTFDSGGALATALKGGELSSDGYVGMVKESEKDGHVAFAPGSCDEGWIDIPADMIGEAEVLHHVPCHEHSHPLVRMSLKLDESNPLHAMARQLLSSAGSQTHQSAAGSPWAQHAFYAGQQRQPIGAQDVAAMMPGEAWSSPVSTGPQYGTATQATVPVKLDSGGMPTGSTRISAMARMPGRLGGAGASSFIECDLDCCAMCCRDCFPWGCHDYPCCTLKNCKIGF